MGTVQARHGSSNSSLFFSLFTLLLGGNWLWNILMHPRRGEGRLVISDYLSARIYKPSEMIWVPGHWLGLPYSFQHNCWGFAKKFLPPRPFCLLSLPPSSWPQMSARTPNKMWLTKCKVQWSDQAQRQRWRGRSFSSGVKQHRESETRTSGGQRTEVWRWSQREKTEKLLTCPEEGQSVHQEKNAEVWKWQAGGLKEE